MAVALAAPARARAVIRDVATIAFAPFTDLTVSQWSDRYRILSQVAEAGPWRTDRVPYLREIMDAFSDPAVERIVAMKSAQLGFTEGLVNNVIGYYIDQEPTNILVVQPNDGEAEKFSKEKLAAMLDATPRLRGKVAEARARSTGSTILAKSFAGGHLGIAGATSPRGLRSRHRRVLLMDEIDGYPESAGSEGDPVMLAEKRTITYWNRKICLFSTPTDEGVSRIEKAYKESDQRRYYVPCPHCGEYQVLEWGGPKVEHGVKWEEGAPDTAYYVCVSGCVIEEREKARMVTQGVWRAENPGHPTRGYWINSLVSLFDGARWGRLAREFLEVKDDPIRLRVFVNTVLGELWRGSGETVDADALFQRIESFPIYPEDEGHERPRLLVPAWAAVLTRSVDVQGDRLETVVYAWGAGERALPLEHEIIAGDPGTQGPWLELDLMIQQRTYRHAGGRLLRPAVTFIDSGGHHTKEVYAFARPRQARRVFACKGSSLGAGVPLLSLPHKSESSKALLYHIGTFAAKEALMARLARAKPGGPGYIHLPQWIDAEHLRQFTAERLERKIDKGRLKRDWRQIYARNEQTDLYVMALAALQVLPVQTRQQLGQRAAALMAGAGDAPAPEPGAPEAGEDSPPPPPDGAPPLRPVPRAPGRRGSFVNRWRGGT